MTSLRTGSAIPEGERQADQARQQLGLGLDAPIAVLEAVEGQAGVPVCIAEFPNDVAGVFYRRSDRSFLFVNGTHPVVRQRFTLAHEYGHCFMQHEPRIESSKSMWASDPQEVQANQFAGAFLAPRQAVRSWADRHAGSATDLEQVVRLSAFFGISPEAGCIRMQASGVLAPGEVNELKLRIRAREHHGLASRLGLSPFSDALSRLKREVGRGVRDLPRVPAVLVQHARQAHEEGLLDEDDFRTVLRGTPIDSAEQDREFEDS